MNEITKRVFISTFLIFTIIFFGIITVTYAENARWAKMTGTWDAKFDGYFNKIAVDQKREIMYAGNGIGAGIYKSIDGGKTWEPINNGLPMVLSTSNYFPIIDIDISETSTETIYLTMRYRGVFKSVNGSNWMERNGKRGMGGFTRGTALPQSEHYVLTMDYNDDNLIFTGTSDGPYKSIDGGENWEPINRNFPLNPLDGSRADITQIIRSSEILYAISNEVQQQAIYKSTTDGGNWEVIGNPLILKELTYLVIKALLAVGTRSTQPFTLPTTAYACLAINSKSNILYVGTSKEGIYKFDENENNWLLANDGLPFDSKGYLPIKSIVLDPVKANTIYTGTWGCGVYKSDNGGGSWSPLNKGLEDSKVRSLALDSQQQIIYAATTEGIFKVNLGGDVRGYVKDSMTNQPISEALIKLYHENDNYTGKYAYSESPNGYFKIRNVPVANYYLTITKSGYSSTRDPKSGTFYVPTTQEEQGIPEKYWGLNRGDVYLTALSPEPVITSSLQILESPPFHVGDTITSVFTITNKGEAPITFDVLTVGGRGPEGETDVQDFDWDHGITLNANESYDYRGNLTLNKPGKYHFFPTYRTPDGNWNSSIPAEEGIIRTLDIEVAAPFAHEVEIKLKDKSIIKGEIQHEKIKIKTKYGEMDIPVENFISIIGELIKLKDGTTLRGNFAEKTLRVKTDYGKLKVQTKEIASIIFVPEIPEISALNVVKEYIKAGQSADLKKLAKLGCKSEGPYLTHEDVKVWDLDYFNYIREVIREEESKIDPDLKLVVVRKEKRGKKTFLTCLVFKTPKGYKVYVSPEGYDFFGYPTNKTENIKRATWFYASNKTNLNKAIELAQKVVKLNPKDKESKYILGYVYAQKGDYKRAISQYKGAMIPILEDAYESLPMPGGWDAFSFALSGGGPTKGDAAVALAKLGDNSGVPFLKETLGDEYLECRVRAALALAELGDRSGIPTLKRWLEPENTYEAATMDATLKKTDAAVALAKLGDKSGTLFLKRQLTSGKQDRDRIDAAVALAKLGDKSGIPILEKVLGGVYKNIDPTEAATALLKLGNESSISIVGKALGNIPSAISWGYLAQCMDAAVVLASRGDKTVIPRLIKLLNHDYFEVRVYTALALIDLLLEDPKLTYEIKKFEQTLKIQAPEYYKLGMSYYNQGKYDKAVEEFKKVVRVQSNNTIAHLYADAYRYLVRSYWHTQKFDEALEKCKRWVKIQPHNADAHYGLGDSYYFKQMYDDAIEEYKKTIQIQPNHSGAHRMLAESYMFKNKYDKAIEELKKVLEIRPENGNIHARLGYAYYRNKMYDEAIVEYKKVLQTKYYSPASAHYYLGRCYYEKNMYDKAITEVNKSLELLKTKERKGSERFRKSVEKFLQKLKAEHKIQQRPKKEKAASNVALGKPCTVITNEAEDYSDGHAGEWPEDITDGSLAYEPVSSGREDGCIAWENRDRDQLLVVTVTIDLDGTYNITKIRYNPGNCERAETWNADIMEFPFGRTPTNPGSSYRGAWTEQTGNITASKVTIKLEKTRRSYATNWLFIGEIEVWGTPIEIEETKEETKTNVISASKKHYQLGLSYYKERKYDQAIEEFTKAIKNQADDANAYYNLALSYYRKNMYDEATSEFKKSVETAQQSSGIFKEVQWAAAEMLQRLNHVFVRDETCNLWVMDIYGNYKEKLTPSTSYGIITPDGSKIAYAWNSDIYVFDLLKKTTTRITAHPANDIYPFWLSDKEKLGFISNRRDKKVYDLYITDSVDSTEKNIERLFMDNNDYTWWNPGSVSLSPNGKKLLLLLTTGGGYATHKFFLIDLTTRSLSEIGESFEAGLPRFSWSPDAQKIVFHSITTKGRAVFILDVNRKTLVELSGGQEPSWSPNGRWITYTSGGIVITRPDGSRTIRLTSDMDYFPVWTSDSKKVLFQRYSPEDEAEIGFRNPRIFIIDISGENLRKLTEKGYHLGRPFFGD